MLKAFTAMTALTGAILLSTAAGAAPLSVSSGAVANSGTLVSDIQYRTRVVTTRQVLRRPVCTVRTVRTRTPRGVIVRKVRTCR
jgi:hypothetical protein